MTPFSLGCALYCYIQKLKVPVPALGKSYGACIKQLAGKKQQKNIIL